jgi:hypothetical protein
MNFKRLMQGGMDKINVEMGLIVLVNDFKIYSLAFTS